MAHSTFKGGVFPHRRKRFTRDSALREYLPKGELVFPVNQHVGGAAVPIVDVGERVLEGQMIARAAGDISVPVHSSVSGTVTAIEPRLTAAGTEILSIVVENDRLYEKPSVPAPPSWRGLEPGERIRRIKDAGIVGMGGGGYPTHLKLSPEKPRKIRRVIVNGIECEPYMTCDYRRMIEEPDALAEGLEAVMSLFPRSRGIFAVSDNMRDAVTALHQATASNGRMFVKVLNTKYPQGSERLLVYACTGVELDAAGHPADAGCLVLNVETVYAVYRALVYGEALTKRAVTVTGKALHEGGNFIARIGTPFSELIEECGGYAREPKKLVCGGPMRGIAVPDAGVPVTKTTAGILCMSKSYDYPEKSCVRCGRCVDACPMRLMPGKLCDLAAAGKDDEFVKLGGMECLGCGSCSYICPARRNLTAAVTAKRKSLIASGLR